MPGMRLRRLANYRRGPEGTRRFAALYYDDLHGSPDWRRHMTLRLAEEIRQELSA